MLDRIPEVPPVILPVDAGIERPLWSIMIPVYNCIRYLKETIESVLAQDLGKDKMQIEVIDDFSTDGDVKRLVEEVGRGRIGYFRQAQNVGSLRNFETCLLRSKGLLIHLLHGDDRIQPGFYQEIDRLFTLYPAAGAAFTNFSYINEQGSTLDIENEKIIDEPGIVKNFLYEIGKRQLIQPPAIVVKRSVYERVGSFYAVHFGEDWEMWCRISSVFLIAYSPRVLAQYRVSHHSSISHQSFLTGQNIKDIKKVINIIQEYIPEEKRKYMKSFAQEYYSIYCIKVANSLLTHNTKVAVNLVKGSLKMSKSIKTCFWMIRFYVMYIFRFKQLQIFFRRSKTNIMLCT